MIYPLKHIIIKIIHLLKNLSNMNWYKDPLWWTAIGTIFLGVVALFGEWLKTKFWHPNIKPEESVIVEQRKKLFVIRLILYNFGRASARELEAVITKIIDPDSKPRDNFIPVPLNWTHSQLWENTRPKIVRDIHPKQPCYLDVADFITDDENNPKLRLSIQACQELENWSLLKKGITKLEIMIYEKSGSNIVIKLEINWKGNLEKPTVEIK